MGSARRLGSVRLPLPSRPGTAEALAGNIDQGRSQQGSRTVSVASAKVRLHMTYCVVPGTYTFDTALGELPRPSPSRGLLEEVHIDRHRSRYCCDATAQFRNMNTAAQQLPLTCLAPVRDSQGLVRSPMWT